MNRIARMLALATLAGAGQAGVAQDFFMGGTSPMDLSAHTRTITNGAINRHSLNAIRRRRAAGGRSAMPAAAVGGGLLTQSASLAPAEIRSVSLPYRATAADQQKAKAAFLQRLAAKSPDSVAHAKDQFARYDFDQIYAGITRPFGLSPNDAADVMTGYMVLGWLIANQAPDPSPASVKAARNGIASLLAQGGQLNNPATRTEVAEELKLLFVVMHSGWTSSRKENKVKPYADGIASYFRTQNGEDMRSIVLTNAGFRPRR